MHHRIRLGTELSQMHKICILLDVILYTEIAVVYMRTYNGHLSFGWLLAAVYVYI